MVQKKVLKPSHLAKSAHQKLMEKVARNQPGVEKTIRNLDNIVPPNERTARVIALFKKWLSDQSGYDEETLPKLKKALDDERRRVGARTLFGD